MVFFSRQIFTTVATLNLQPLQQLARQEVPESSEMLGFRVSCGCKNAGGVGGLRVLVFGGLGRVVPQLVAGCLKMATSMTSGRIVGGFDLSRYNLCAAAFASSC